MQQEVHPINKSVE